MKFGLCGYGVMGRNHERVFKKLGHQVEIFDPKIPKFSDFDLFLEKSLTFDGISICSPTSTHVNLALKILDYNYKIHLLIEKPISNSVHDSWLLGPYVDRIVVGHIERYNPVIQKIKELYKGKQLGQIFSILTQRCGPCPVRDSNNNVAIDLLVHDIDAMGYILEQTPTVTSRSYISTSKSEVIDLASITCKYGNTITHSEANWLLPIKVRTIKLTCSDAYLECNYIKQTINFHSASGNSHKIKLEYIEPLLKEIQDFILFCQGENPPTPCGLESAISCLQTIDG